MQPATELRELAMTDLDFDTDGSRAVDAQDAYWNNGTGWLRWAPAPHVSARPYTATATVSPISGLRAAGTTWGCSA